jgi:hypothetical protein
MLPGASRRRGWFVDSSYASVDRRRLTVDVSALDDDAGSVAVVVQLTAGGAVLEAVLRSLA